MAIQFVYQPTYGPLSGASFEEQTVAFFEALQTDLGNQITAINANISDVVQSVAVLREAVAQNTNAIAALQGRCQDIEENVQANANDIAALQQQTSDLSSSLSALSTGPTTRRRL